MNRYRLSACSVVFFLLLSLPSYAQWKTQQMQLVPGWNAVHLEVDPGVRNADAIFSSVPVESVWKWNARFSSVRFLSDPDDLAPDNPDWLVYFPPTSTQAPLKTLFSLNGGEAYLVKLGGTKPVVLNILGQPVPQEPDWISDSYNLVGFEIDSAVSPTLEKFFESAPHHNKFHRLTASGEWKELSPKEKMKAGEALWVYSDGPSNFAGPLQTKSLGRRVVRFVSTDNSYSFDLENVTESQRNITVELLESEQPPIVDAPQSFASPPLALYRLDVSGTGLQQWDPVEVGGNPVELTLGPNRSRFIQLAVRREDAPAIPAGQFANYQAILRITDGEGAAITIGVAADAQDQSPSGRRLLARRGATAPHPYAGLWVGDAVINQVNQPENRAAPGRLEAAAGEFRIRLLVHVDETGNPRLVHTVTAMSRVNAGERELVLVTNDELLDDFEGIFERDGALVGQRITTVAFPFFNVAGEPRNTMPAKSGSFEDGDATTTETLLYSVPMDFDDPINPFFHRYHPDHDVKDFNFRPYPATTVNLDGTDLRFSDSERQESYAVLRDITLTFIGTDPNLETVNKPGWLADRVGGFYLEEIRGLYRTDLRESPPVTFPIRTGGTFSLTRVTGVPTLNGGAL